MLIGYRKRGIMAARAAGLILPVMMVAAQPGHAATHVFATFADAGEIVSGRPIVSLTIPPGRYAILAKINLDQDDGHLNQQLLTVSCVLAPSSGAIDLNVIRLHPSAIEGSKASDNITLPFQIVTELRSNTVISLFCFFDPPLSRKLSFRFAKLTALRLEGRLCERRSPATCDSAASAVLGTFKESGTIVPGTPIVKLSVPSGKYAIFAKINIDQDDADDRVRLVCTLRAGADVDRNVLGLQPSGGRRLDNAAVHFQAVEEFRTEWVDPVPPDPPLHDINLFCRISNGKSSQLSFRFAKIMAIRLDGDLCEQESVATCP